MSECMISPMNLTQLELRCGGQRHGSDVRFESVSTDTRSLRAGDLFVALSGENFDGNRFALDATNLNACGVVVSEKIDTNVAQLVTPDTRHALGDIAAHCREHFNKPVIAITGSSGKTTARRMLTAIMERRGPVCTNYANNNNEVGVPFTLLTLGEHHASAVIEMGARHLGDISYLGKFVQPDVAILLNAGTAHIGEFGGYQNIVKAKGEIYQSLRANGIAIVNLDDPASDQWMASLQQSTCLTFSLDASKNADVTAQGIGLNSETVKFELGYQNDSIAVTINATGRHSVSNALACAAAALAVGISLEDIAAGLACYRSESGRSHMISLGADMNVIDDSYNANPASMRAALDTLELQSGHKIAVLGEMGELGEDAEQLHMEIAMYCRDKLIEEFWFIGRYAEKMTEVVGSKARVFQEKNQISKAMQTLNKSGVVVLLKASRFMALEEVITNYVEAAN